MEITYTKRGKAMWTVGGVQYVADPETGRVWPGVGVPTADELAKQTEWFAGQRAGVVEGVAERDAAERALRDARAAEKSAAEEAKADRIAELRAVQAPNFAQRAELLALEISWMFSWSPDEYRRQYAVVTRLLDAAVAQESGRLFCGQVLVVGLRDAAVLEDYAKRHGAASNRCLLLLDGRDCGVTRKTDRRGKTLLVVDLGGHGHNLRVSETQIPGGFQVITSNAGNQSIWVG